ncbi:MAG: bifunctional methylenetetrahydrofolate dehydrogenase/methenyltetrahydrofolate cyclohydrolase FolD [Coriobacteriia bacterium]|nr:bifunctional methylenetetrahydrofolate dehydrogenase/methenyltetrahydrofolate cyclohydrolase FolD [Coriobacteriia bacterium]
MSARIIDGAGVAAAMRQRLAEEVSRMRAGGVEPALAVVVVGDDPASRAYVRSKEKACAEVGIRSEKHAMPAGTTQEELLGLVGRLNEDPAVDGILVQLPLPDHIDEQAVIRAISPAKDVDGFHPENIGNLLVGKPTFEPCTPRGVMVLLQEAGVELSGKEAVVVGRSNIVGKPVALMLQKENATVTVCHTRTADVGSHLARADVVVVAAGRPSVVDGTHIKEGAVVVDVGINRVDGKLVGDVDFESAARKASAITPVPGGVGPMTVAVLMENTVKAARQRAGSA